MNESRLIASCGTPAHADCYVPRSADVNVPGGCGTSPRHIGGVRGGQRNTRCAANCRRGTSGSNDQVSDAQRGNKRARATGSGPQIMRFEVVTFSHVLSRVNAQHRRSPARAILKGRGGGSKCLYKCTSRPHLIPSVERDDPNRRNVFSICSTAALEQKLL